MWRSIPDLLEMMCRNNAAVIIIRGNGGVFAAGADLAELELLRTIEEAEDNWNAISNALMAVAECPVPTIASIDGACIGGGCLLAIACDLRYATDRSVFGVPVAKLGIVLDDGSVKRLAALVGAATAREMLMRGNMISAAQAAGRGLINEFVADGTELTELLERVTTELLENSPPSIEASRRSIGRVCGLNSFPTMEDPSCIVESYLTDDFRARVARALGR